MWIMRDYGKLWLRQAFALTWGWGDTISGLLGSAVPIAAHFFPQWGQRVSESLWMTPIWGLATAAFFRFLLVAPYELWKQERAKADLASERLEAIAQTRPLRFTDAEFRFDYSKGETGPFAEIRLSHQNIASILVGYRLENVWVKVDGQTIFMGSPLTTTYQQPFTNGHFDCPLLNGVDITSYPAPIIVNFDYYYDTVPPTRERRSGATLRYVLTGPKHGDPVQGYWYDDQREE